MEGEGSSKNNYKNASTIYITPSRDTLNQRHNQQFKMAQICRLNCPLFSFGACDLPDDRKAICRFFCSCTMVWTSTGWQPPGSQVNYQASTVTVLRNRIILLQKLNFEMVQIRINLMWILLFKMLRIRIILMRILNGKILWTRVLLFA